MSKHATSHAPEAWLGGPIEGVTPHLMPVAHALVQVGRDVEKVKDLSPDALWVRPGGAASVGFHLKHVAGVLDRLLTYARGADLSEEQLGAMRRTSDKHLGQPDTGLEQSTEVEGLQSRRDGNNVQMDRELLAMTRASWTSATEHSACSRM